jgi:hypothetical protein
LFKLVRFVQFMIYGGVLQKTVAGSGGVEGGRWRPIVQRLGRKGKWLWWFGNKTLVVAEW